VITRIRASLAANPLAVDAVIAIGLAALSLVSVASGDPTVGRRETLSVFLLLMESLPLVFRRRWPLAVFAVTVGATVLHASLADGVSVNEGFGSLVALFTVAERYERRVSAPAALVMAVLFVGMTASKVGILTALTGGISTMLAVGVVWALGDWVRTRRRYTAAIEESARILEADREERARRAVQDERERIARELHDVVTHHVSVIVIQAGAAERALDRRPADAREAINAIDSTARQALADMRRMLGILGRPAAGGAGGREGDLAPMPGLDGLGELLEQVRSAGMPVQLSVTGERRTLDPGIELSAYRIIQEALTNALRHAPGARTRVAVGYGPTALEIQVDDEGARSDGDAADTGAALGGSGRGLIGMRERVAVFGGEFEAYTTERGFRVRALLPLGAGAS
jgi:signal transduction histidine kinase